MIFYDMLKKFSGQFFCVWFVWVVEIDIMQVEFFRVFCLLFQIIYEGLSCVFFYVIFIQFYSCKLLVKFNLIF